MTLIFFLAGVFMILFCIRTQLRAGTGGADLAGFAGWFGVFLIVASALMKLIAVLKSLQISPV